MLMRQFAIDRFSTSFLESIRTQEKIFQSFGVPRQFSADIPRLTLEAADGILHVVVIWTEAKEAI